MAHRIRRPRGKLQVARDYKAITVRLSPDSFKQLDTILDHSDLSLTSFVEYAIALHFNTVVLATRRILTPARVRREILAASLRSVEGDIE